MLIPAYRNQALVWLIARAQALTKLEFDVAKERAATNGVNIDGEITKEESILL